MIWSSHLTFVKYAYQLRAVINQGVLASTHFSAAFSLFGAYLAAPKDCIFSPFGDDSISSTFQEDRGGRSIDSCISLSGSCSSMPWHWLLVGCSRSHWRWPPQLKSWHLRRALMCGKTSLSNVFKLISAGSPVHTWTCPLDTGHDYLGMSATCVFLQRIVRIHSLRLLPSWFPRFR